MATAREAPIWGGTIWSECARYEGARYEGARLHFLVPEQTDPGEDSDLSGEGNRGHLSPVRTFETALFNGAWLVCRHDDPKTRAPSSEPAPDSDPIAPPLPPPLPACRDESE